MTTRHTDAGRIDDAPESADGACVGVTYTDQVPATADMTVTLGDVPPSEVWTDLADTDRFREGFVDAVLDATRDRTYVEAHEALEEANVDALHGSYRSLLVRTAQGDESALWALLSETRRLGSGRSPFDDVLGAARVFALALDHTPDRRVPTIAVRVTEAFRDRRADQRRVACDVITTLSEGCDVRLVATGLVTRWLAREHREDLPGVSEACSTTPRPGSIDDVVTAARDALDSDGREVTLLRDLADDTTETHPYSALYAKYAVSRSRIRQALSRLRELGLIDTFDGTGGKHAELLAAGRAFLEAVDAEIGRQRRLDECVSDTGKSSQQCRVTPREDEGGEGTAGAAAAGAATPYRTEYLSRAAHHAAEACASDGGITLLPASLPGETAGDHRIRWVSYTEDRDEAVVAVRASGPLQYVVSLATALASPRFIDRALPLARLEEIDDPPAILRDARCIGALSAEAVDDPQVLRDALVAWGEDLEALTTKLYHGEYEDRDRFRSEIMRSAHGLAGTVAHLLDVAGVDLVREVRVPGGLDRETKLAPLARSVALSAAIQSTYGAFATYRQLYESRDDKRATALSPEVDAADPLGELIGRFVIRGPDVERVESALTAALRNPADLHDEAPEFMVPVSVRSGVGRPAYATAVQRMCDAKGMDTTREAVSLLQGLTGSPYAAAAALHGLAPEAARRSIHLDEVRRALGTLSAERILPDAPPTVSEAVHALLTVSEPLSQATLADRAEVSPRSLRTHLPRLDAFGLVEETDQGYRLALPFREERGADHGGDVVDLLPWYLRPNRERDDYRDATEKGVLWTVVEASPGFDGGDAVLDAMQGLATVEIPPDVREAILDVWPWAEPFLETVRVLAADEPTTEAPIATVTLGPTPEQAAVGSGGDPPGPGGRGPDGGGSQTPATAGDGGARA